MKFGVEINNLPDGDRLKEYILTVYVDGELWYYGTWDDRTKAEKAMRCGVDNGLIVQKI